MLILAIICFGLLAGGLAQLILGRSFDSVHWSLALGAGLGGSFVGGLLLSFLNGDGLSLSPSGLFGSVVGAILVTVAWGWWTARAKS